MPCRPRSIRNTAAGDDRASIVRRPDAALRTLAFGGGEQRAEALDVGRRTSEISQPDLDL
jgi:hypothetical protein